MSYRIEDNSVPRQGTHTVKLDDRRVLSVTGVTDVDGFDEHTIVLATPYGIITVTGSELHINKLNIDEGCLDIEGNVDSIQYSSADRMEKGGWMSRLFR